MARNPTTSMYVGILARVGLGIFALAMFASGGLVAGVAFHDPDTCWLLALGRWIVQHHRLPFIDPISSWVASYTTISPGMPLMQYQWLPEIIFYLALATTGLTGLLLVVALIIYFAYVALPWSQLKRGNVPCYLSILLIVFSIILASSRFLARPQIFSFLFLSALLNILLSRDFKNAKVLTMQAVSSACVMAVWSNCHILFPLGLAVLVIVSYTRVLEWALFRRSSKLPTIQLLTIPIAGTAATFLNPWGPGIWIFFRKVLGSPINTLVTENSALNILDPSAIALVLFALTYVVLAAHTIWTVGIRNFPLTTVPLSMLAVAIGISHASLISFSPLLLMAAITELYWYRSKLEEPTGSATIGNALETELSRMTSPMPAWTLLNGFPVAAGTCLIANVFSPTMPESSASFQVPFEAIAYLQAHRPKGHVLNDPQFGSVMSWYCKQPDVFIDTRFAQFEEQHILDYQTISLAKDGWQQIIGKYQFDWVFMPPNKPIVKELAKLGWTTVYHDNKAIILLKPVKPN